MTRRECFSIGVAWYEAICREVPGLTIGPQAWLDMAFHCGTGAFTIATPMEEHGGRRGHGEWLGAKRSEALALLRPPIDGATDDPWVSVGL